MQSLVEHMHRCKILQGLVQLVVQPGARPDQRIYRRRALIEILEGVNIDMDAGTGVAAALAANRISFSLGLRGPSMTIDTACAPPPAVRLNVVQNQSCGKRPAVEVGSCPNPKHFCLTSRNRARGLGHEHCAGAV